MSPSTVPADGSGSATPEARYHATRFTYDPGRAGVWREICRYLQPYIAEDRALLDLGAGWGEFSRHARVSRKYALDCNPELVPHWGPAVIPIVQSALDPVPLPSGSLGTVVTSNFFEHFTQPEGEAILREVWRMLAPGGRLIAVQPNFRLEPRRYFDDYTHKTPYTDAGFNDFLRALGWRIIRNEPRFLPFSMKSRLPKAGWMVRLYLALPWRPFAGQFLIIAEKNVER